MELADPYQKILILSLGRRGGSVRYGTAIINAMSEVPKDVVVSSYCSEIPPQFSIKIPTYRNKLEFLLASVFILPILVMIVGIRLTQKQYLALYTPYTHHWNWPFLLLFNCFGLKTVSTIHDGIPHSGDGNVLQKWINRYTLRSSKELIFLTEYVQKYLKQNLGYQGRSWVIPHGLIEIIGVRPEIKRHPYRFNILFLGRVCHYKGVDLLIEALQQVDREKISQIVIAGEPTPDQMYLKNGSPQIPITWIDRWLTEQEMADQIKQAHILILPYREATQSGVITIGISAGIPMVITDVGGLHEQCLRDECVLVEANPTSIAQGLQNLMDDPSHYAKIQEALGLKRKALEWSKIAQDILKVLHDKP